MLDRFHYIAVEGPIGVGKTSLAQALAEKLSARPILEEVETNPFLPYFYENREKYAFQVQVFFLAARYKQQIVIGQPDLFHRLTISDYLFEKDRLFATLCLNSDEMQLYDRLQPLLAARIPTPDLLILLQADIETLMERIRSRGRVYEEKMDRPYLERVIAAYDQYFFRYDKCPVLVVNSKDVHFQANPAELEDLIKQMGRIQSGRQYYTPAKTPKRPFRLK